MHRIFEVNKSLPTPVPKFASGQAEGTPLELRQRLLLDIFNGQRKLTDPSALMSAASEALGRHLAVDRVGFYGMPNPHTLEYTTGWSNGRLPLLSGTMSVSGMGVGWAEIARAGTPFGIRDVADHPITFGSKLAELGVRSTMGASIVREGVWHTGFYVNHSEIRDWADDEISLAFEVADITWDAVNRFSLRRALHQSEARSQRILESIGDAVIVTDVEAHITRMNGVAEQLTGWPLAEAFGKPLGRIFNIVDETSRLPVENPVQKVKRLNTVAGLANHTILLNREGKEFHIDESGSPIREANGDLSGIVLTFRDISDKRHLEQEREALLKEVSTRSAELEAIYNNAAVAMALIDPVEFHYLRVNRKLCEMLEQSPQQVVGSKVSDVAGGVPGLDEALRKVAAGQPIIGGLIEGELSTAPGVKRSWTMDYSPVFGADGKVVAIAAASAEITRQKLAEAALIHTEKLAAVGRLASSIAHEINNPLASVTNLLYLVRLHDLAPNIDGFLETAERELRRVSEIVNQTLRFHKQSTNPTRSDIRELIDGVLAIHHVRLVNARLKVEKRFKSQRLVNCYEGEIRQVVNNLIGNAIDAMPVGGRLLLRTRDAHSPTTGLDGVVITVADTGQGMSKPTAAKAFDPFFTTKGFSGTGLGLWISHEIALRHEGKLHLRSSQTPNHTGTVITLYLPIQAAIR